MKILRIARATLLASVLAMLAACGGGDSGSTPTGFNGGNGGTTNPGNGGGGQTPVITGVATPSSVSVVTATNAN
jgi:hypothetical protein